MDFDIFHCSHRSSLEVQWRLTQKTGLLSCKIKALLLLISSTFCWQILPSYMWVLSILTGFLTSDKHRVTEWHTKREPKVFFFLLEQQELVVFPPPFTLLNNKTKRNAVSLLSTLWALKYSFLVHSFTELGQRCEPISHAQRGLIWMSYWGREKGEKIFKRFIWQRNIWTTFWTSEKHFFFLIYGKRYLYKTLYGAKHYHPKAKHGTERWARTMKSQNRL